MKRAMLFALLGAAACVSLSCDRVLGIPERTLDTRIECTDGQCACVGEFGDCDGDLDNGCETDTRSAQAHCGMCGHDCLGGECAEGRCQPVRVTSLEEGVSSFALKEGILYATVSDIDNPFGFERVDVREPTPTPMETPPINALPYAQRMYAGTGALIFCDFLGVQALSLETWTVTQLFDNVDAHVDMCAPAGGTVWWTADLITNTITAVVYRAREDGVGGAVAVQKAKDMSAPDVFADDEGAYLWNDQTGVLRRYPHDGSAAVPVPNTPPNGGQVLASDAKNLYLASSGDGGYTLFAVPRDGGDPREIAPMEDMTSRGTADAGYVYLPDYSRGTISRIPIAGGAEEVIASGQNLGGDQPIYVDERAVYWLGGDAVWRVIK